MAAATARLTAMSGQVGSTRPSHAPSATPVRPACEIVSLKNAIRRAVTKTPSNAQSGARNRAPSSARCIHGSVSMMMVVGRDVNAEGLLERLAVHDLVGLAFAADDAIERINPV